MEEVTKKQNGGKRKGAGRKSKADEKKVNVIFLKALKELYKKDKDDDSKVEFVKTLLESQRGQIFVAEHLFGKPKEIIEAVVLSPELSKKEAKIIKGVIDKRY